MPCFQFEMSYMWQFLAFQKNDFRYMWQTRLVSSFKRPQSVPPRRDFPWETATYSGFGLSGDGKSATYSGFQMRIFLLPLARDVMRMCILPEGIL